MQEFSSTETLRSALHKKISNAKLQTDQMQKTNK